MRGLGYVGYGEVILEARMIKDFSVGGTPLLDMPLKAEQPMDNKEDPKLSEWVVGIKWSKALPREKARTFRGVFANQNIVCKLRHPETVTFLEREFAVTKG